jgi:hypothetical protein
MLWGGGQDSSTIAMANSGNCAVDGGMAARLQWAMVAVMGNGGGNGQGQESQWEMLQQQHPMAVNGGGAMDGRTAATAQLQSP